ncbi:uncharacterized protein rhbdd2 isoform X2 [Narcine bancroftii]|uniref:uncharacterized protein rhbdd2 isoform X2 n=1 Tax=Narcine bancroftii TaxID=1343680 RepID=UPI0038312116
MAARRGQGQRDEERSDPPSLVRMVRSLMPCCPAPLSPPPCSHGSCSTSPAGTRSWTDTLSLSATSRAACKVADVPVYKVLSYMFIHKSMSALVCNVFMLWYFGGAMEKDIGTVKFAYLTLLFGSLAGIIYAIFGSIFFGLENRKEIQGFTVVVFAYVGMSVFTTPLKYVVFITRIKLILDLADSASSSRMQPPSHPSPKQILLRKDASGRKYFPYLDLHELTAASLERYFPFNSLKNLPGITFYSALWEVRNVEMTNRCNPKPGSYPIQTYYIFPSTDPQHCYYSGNLKEQQQYISYNLENIPGFGCDVGRASGHGHSNDIIYPSGHRHSHDLRQTSENGHSGLGNELGLASGHIHCHDLGHASGHGRSHDVSASDHKLVHNLGHGHDLVHTYGYGFPLNFAHKPEHKPDSQCSGEMLNSSSGLQQGSSLKQNFEDSCSVVMN